MPFKVAGEEEVECETLEGQHVRLVPQLSPSKCGLLWGAWEGSPPAPAKTWEPSTTTL